MESLYSVPALPVSWAMAEREFASVPRSTRYPVTVLPLLGAVHVSFTLS